MDGDMIRQLQSRFPVALDNKQLTLILGDVLRLPLPVYSTCVANLPYYVLGVRQAFCVVVFGFPSEAHIVGTLFLLLHASRSV